MCCQYIAALWSVVPILGYVKHRIYLFLWGWLITFVASSVNDIIWLLHCVTSLPREREKETEEREMYGGEWLGGSGSVKEESNDDLKAFQINCINHYCLDQICLVDSKVALMKATRHSSNWTFSFFQSLILYSKDPIRKCSREKCPVCLNIDRSKSGQLPHGHIQSMLVGKGGGLIHSFCAVF